MKISNRRKVDLAGRVFWNMKTLFQTFGKYNIGITAGVETTAVSGKWLECCNKMDFSFQKRLFLSVFLSLSPSLSVCLSVSLSLYLLN